MKTEKEIRKRIALLTRKGNKKVHLTEKNLQKEGMKGLMLLSERYSLWWVLGEIRKHQGFYKTQKVSKVKA
jgi:hypothetical protein